jgi:hypothetical protein
MTETEWSFFRLLPMDLTSVMSAGAVAMHTTLQHSVLVASLGVHESVYSLFGT